MPDSEFLLGYMVYVIAVLLLAVISVPVVRRHLSYLRQVLQSVREPSTLNTVDIFLPLSNQP